MRAILLSFVLLSTALMIAPTEAAAQGVDAQDAQDTQDTHGAHDEEARLHFEIAERALSDGRYEEALREFERSYALSARPALLFNIGVAHQRLRNDQEALTAYRRFVSLVPEAEATTDVERRIEILEGVVVQLPANADTPHSGDPLAPAAAARTVMAGTPQADPEPAEDGGIFTKWWFWTLVGVVVVGAGVGITVAVSGGESLPTGFGPVVQTLQPR